MKEIITKTKGNLTMERRYQLHHTSNNNIMNQNYIDNIRERKTIKIGHRIEQIFSKEDTSMHELFININFHLLKLKLLKLKLRPQ